MRLLLVEDELDLASMVRIAFEKQGFVTDHAPSLAIAEEAVQTIAHDAVILDRKLADGDGLDFLSHLRRTRPDMPVIILSAMGSASDRVEGLNLGADDYIGKPFVVDELVARIRAVLRRPAQVSATPIRLGNLEFDVGSGLAAVDGLPLDLPRRELLALESLVKRSGRTVRRSLLEEEIYGADDEIQSNALDAHISRLRRKLAEAGATAEIHAVRGVGYLIKVPT